MRRLGSMAVALFCVAVFLQSALGATICVSKAGSDDTGDGTAGNPYATIQKGVWSAPEGSTVLVSAGIYQESLQFPGYALTVTSADPDDPAVVAATVIDGSTHTWPALIFNHSETNTTVITGFTIRDGHAYPSGVIYAPAGAPTITKNVITNNSGDEDQGTSAGGAMAFYSGSPVITYNTITNNSASHGGAIIVSGCTGAVISHNVISNNTAINYAGGIWAGAGGATISDNVITDNVCQTYFGGGIALFNNAGTPSTVTNNKILRNKSCRSGGGIYVEDHAVSSISGNVIEGNVIEKGEGAAVYILRGAAVAFANNLICGNRGLTTEAYSGAFTMNMPTLVTIDNCTFFGNSVINGHSGSLSCYNTSVTVANSIFRGNTSPTGYQVFLQNTGSATVSYCDVQGGESGVYHSGGSYTWGEGNIDADPLFASPGTLDTNGTRDDLTDDTWTEGDYHEKSLEGRWDPAANGGAGAWAADGVQSPCIDAGDPASLWGLEPDPNGFRVNMGAYGNTAYASKSPGADLTIAIDPPGAGTLSPFSGTQRITRNKTFSIAAYPTAPYTFMRWTADPPGNASFDDELTSTTDLTVTGDVTVTAYAGIHVNDPVFSPPAGSYTTARNVEITTFTPAASIYYTTDGSEPATSSTLYAGPIPVAVTTTIRAFAVKAGMEDSNVVGALYIIDDLGPLAMNLSTVPTMIREGHDLSLTLLATADDSTRGGSAIAEAEYFVGADPGESNGTEMSAVDGVFDSSSEGVTATIDVSTWAKGSYQFHVRAKDAAGTWGATSSKLVLVVDGVAPGAVTNLAVTAVGSLERLSATINAYSSDIPAYPVTSILDSRPGTRWQTAGTATNETQFVTLDVFSTKRVDGVLVTAGPVWALFPAEMKIETSKNGTEWTEAVWTKGFKASKYTYLWQFEPVDARYVKLSGPGVLNAADHKYCWQIADISLYKGGGALVDLGWTSTADDGYIGSNALRYDLRYSTSPLDGANFDAATAATGLSMPKPPGALERQFVRLNVTSGTVYLALKVGDEVPNWSSISNVVQADAFVTGFILEDPDDQSSTTADSAPTFQFVTDPTAKPAYICFSSCREFVSKQTMRPDGQLDMTLKAAIKPGSKSWKPTASQWKSMKKLVLTGGNLWWRLEGNLFGTLGTFGPARRLLFDSGEIESLAVDGSHAAGPDEAVWPDVAAAPVFQWTNLTTAMQYFLVDVSTDPNIPIKDKKKTVLLGGSGLAGASYATTAADWKKLRKLATLGNGTLYWRVRAKDADKCLTSASGVKKLVIDGGEWSVGALDLSSATPSVAWTHAGDGITKYCLQFSADAAFPATTKKTLVVPAKSFAAASYNLTAADVTKLKKLATMNTVTTLYYRVRGEDAEKAFLAYSDSNTVAVW